MQEQGTSMLITTNFYVLYHFGEVISISIFKPSRFLTEKEATVLFYARTNYIKTTRLTMLWLFKPNLRIGLVKIFFENGIFQRLDLQDWGLLMCKKS